MTVYAWGTCLLPETKFTPYPDAKPKPESMTGSTLDSFVPDISRIASSSPFPTFTIVLPPALTVAVGYQSEGL